MKTPPGKGLWNVGHFLYQKHPWFLEDGTQPRSQTFLVDLRCNYPSLSLKKGSMSIFIYRMLLCWSVSTHTSCEPHRHLLKQSSRNTPAWRCKGVVIGMAVPIHPFSSLPYLIRMPSLFSDHQYAQLRPVFLYLASSYEWPCELVLANNMQGCDFWDGSFKGCQTVGKGPFLHIPPSSCFWSGL